MQIITEVLQSIKASDMTPLLKRIYESDGGNECLDVLMKYMYVKLTYPGVGKGLVLTVLPLATRVWALGKATRAAVRQQRSRPNRLAASARLVLALVHPTSLRLRQ